MGLRDCNRFKKELHLRAMNPLAKLKKKKKKKKKKKAKVSIFLGQNI